MIKTTLIRGIINLSSSVQTKLINYLEFHQSEPKEMKEKGYDSFNKKIKKPEKSAGKPFQKEDVIKPHYSILLKIADRKGRPINPVCRREVPLRTEEKYCRKCKAPQEYLTNHGFYTRKSTEEKFPKHTCKVCMAEYAPGAERKKPKHVCPFCSYAMNPVNYRKNYTTYFCKNKKCEHLKLHPKRNRYNEKEWHFKYDNLKTNDINTKHSLEKIRISKTFLDKELSLLVECGVTGKETINILSRFYGEKYIKSHQTVFNHAKAVAEFIKENEEFLPMPLGDKICEDETYVKYKGKWGYLHRAFNPNNRAIIAEHYSKHRDTKACIILNKLIVKEYEKQFRDPCFTLVSDSAPIYKSMKGYFEDHELAIINHKPVTGIFDGPNEKNPEYRPQKQMIERSFESLKSAIKRRRTFSSFHGANVFCFLHKIYYNHLRPHQTLNNSPPIPLFLKSGQQVKCWNQLLQYITEKRR